MKIKISICTVEHFLIYMWSHAVFLSSLHAPMMRLIGALKTQSLVGPDIMSDTLLLEEDWSAPPSILETAGVLIILIMVSISLTAREMLPFLHQTFSEVRYEKEDSFKLFWQRDTLSTNWIRSGINILSYLPFLGRILGCTVLAISSWKVGLQTPKMWSLEAAIWGTNERACPNAIFKSWVGLGVGPFVYSALIEQHTSLVLQPFAGGGRRCWYLGEATHIERAWDTLAGLH